jgi:hypothetical protein
MATSLNALAASEHIADLHRAANGRGAGRAGLRRRRSTAAVSSARPAVAVRFARPDEGVTLRRLAQLDDAPELAGELLRRNATALSGRRRRRWSSALRPRLA